jgi:hypothetical protein
VDNARELADESCGSSARAHRGAADASDAAAKLYDRLEDPAAVSMHREAAARHRSDAAADDD